MHCWQPVSIGQWEQMFLFFFFFFFRRRQMFAHQNRNCFPPKHGSHNKQGHFPFGLNSIVSISSPAFTGRLLPLSTGGRKQAPLCRLLATGAQKARGVACASVQLCKCASVQVCLLNAGKRGLVCGSSASAGPISHFRFPISDFDARFFPHASTQASQATSPAHRRPISAATSGPLGWSWGGASGPRVVSELSSGPRRRAPRSLED